MSTNQADTAELKKLAVDSVPLEDAVLAMQRQEDLALTLQTRAEIDVQIATAHAFPRSLTAFKRKLSSMACLDPDTAEACTYAVPRGGKTITGKSIRFAEMMLASYGNIRAVTRVVGRRGNVIVCEAIAHDLESNAAVREEVERRITDKHGKLYNEDMQVVTGRAGCSIALRNAIFRIVPGALVEDVYQEVIKVAQGDAKTLPQRRQERLAYFEKHGIKPAQVFTVLEVKGLEDIDLDKIVILQAMVNAHRSGEASLEELFPPPDPAARSRKASAAAEAKLKASGQPGQGAKETAQHMEEKLHKDQPNP